MAHFHLLRWMPYRFQMILLLGEFSKYMWTPLTYDSPPHSIKNKRHRRINKTLTVIHIRYV